MKALFPRIIFICGCLSMSISALAYTSTDCTNVEQLATKGVVSYKNTCREYNLDRTITRQEVAAVTLRVGEICGAIQNIPPTGQYTCDNLFSDVSATYPNEWVCRVAETLARDGIVSQNDQNQYGDVFFRPLKNVTRAEALAMLMNGANLEFQDTIYDDWRFSGTGAVAWQKPLMQYAYDRDVISSITTFGPNTNAYRRDVFNYAIKAINLCQTNGGNYNYNNYSNNNCTVGQYSSGNTCYSCSGLPWNGYYTTRGTCDWSCNSGYIKSGNTCVTSNNNYYGVGQCGSTVNSCISGTFYDVTDYGNYAYWNCTGTNGVAVTCSAYNNNYGTTAQCGTTVNSCISGTFYDTTDSGNYAYWNCTGTNGVAVSCSAYNSNYNNCTAGQYMSGNTCYSCGATPTNGYYGTSGSCTVTCYSGFYYNSSTNTCVSNYNTNNCSVGQYWTGNMCLGCTSKPSYAYYSTSGTCDWTCNSGYYRSGDTCISNYGNTTCSTGQYLSGNTCYSCGTAPWNGYYTTTGTCDWSCNSGYYKSGNTCVSNYNTTCGVGQYMSGNTCYSCSGLPWNGYYTTTGTCDWSCNSGYYKSGNTCVSNYNYGTTAQCGTAVNSCISGTFYDTTDSGNYAYWNCTGTNGVAVTCSAYNNNYYGNCSAGQYLSNGTCYSCGTYPSNGYYATAGSCTVTCNAGYTYNSYTNTCTTNYNSGNNCSISMPSNAYYTNSQNCWSCNAGFVQINNMCVWWN